MAKTKLEGLTETIPISIYKFFVRRDVIGFLYHVVSNEALPHVRHIYPYKSPEQFDRDLVYLKQNYNLISYEELYDHYSHKSRLKPQAALLSFDDGFRECFSVVRSLLKSQAVPCIFFITTDLIDNRAMLFRNQVSLCIEKVVRADEAWRRTAFTRIKQSLGKDTGTPETFMQWIKSLESSDQGMVEKLCRELEVDVTAYLNTRKPYLSAEAIRSLVADGFTIGAHSKSHPRLNRLSPQALEEEIVGSCRVIREMTGKVSVPFSFPFSAFGLKRDSLEGIRARNREVGLCFDTKGIRADREFITSRIWADPPPQDRRGGESNLPELVLHAYQDVLLAKMRRLKLYRGKLENNPLLTNLDLRL